MKDLMHHPQSEQPSLPAVFENWLKEARVPPPVNLAEQVRARLQETADPVDMALDELFQVDPGLARPGLAWKVRARLTGTSRRAVWTRWMAPLAAAATLAVAFVSFQSTGPRVTPETPAAGLAAAPDLDSELTRILALASGLDATTDVAKLESVDNLVFLFN